MAYRQTAFAAGEWYHCYSRSIDKKTVFLTQEDFERFLQAMYLGNSKIRMNRSDFRNPSHYELLSVQRGIPLVAIGAYALMPNHFHLLIQAKEESGVSSFMQKLGTSFSMYFNAKHKRVGNVFIKPFRAKHISDDIYLRRVRQYIHLNAAELFEPKWKNGEVRNLYNLEKRLHEYRYSSLPDYYQLQPRTERNILDPEAISFLAEAPPLSSVLAEAREYYESLGEIPPEV